MDEYKISSSPHVRSKDTTSDIMFDVLIALVPATVFGMHQFGLHAVWLVLTCVLSCVGIEALTQFLLHRKITVGDFSAAVTGLLLALNLPPTLPLWMAFLGCVFAIVVVKQLFGGLGQNFMNPALAARCFLLLSFTARMTTFVYDGVTTATPLAVLKSGGSVSLRDMFLGFTGGTIGETSAAALLIGACYLLIKRVISPKIPLFYLGTFAACMAIFALVRDFDVLKFTAAQLCGGGLMLGAWFMATDYVTSPITPNGKIIYGIILGLLTFTLRIFGNSAEGVSYAIILSNLLVPLIERITVPKAFGEGADIKKEEKKKKKEDPETIDAPETKDASETKDDPETKDAPEAKDDTKTKNTVEISEKQSKKEKSTDTDKFDLRGIVRAVVVIFVITLFMGAALGTVYNLTKKPIEESAEKAKQEAFKEVYPDAADVAAASGLDYEKLNDNFHKLGYASSTIDEINFALDEQKNHLGYIIVVTNSEGYGGDIQIVLGVDVTGEIKGLSFLAINESKGLGMNAKEDPDFAKQFVGKNVNRFVYTKTGASEENEIDALSGATITTSAVVEGVNAAIAIVHLIGGAVNE